MPSTEYLKQCVRDKLAAAAEEIFSVFHNTIVEYEEELDRHRKLLDVVAWRPVVKLRRTELPQQIVFKEELIVTDQSSLDQDRNSSLDQEQLELPQVEEKQEEVINSEFSLKQELEEVQLCSADEKSNTSENPTADWNPEEPLHESKVNIPVITFVVSGANSDVSLYPGVSQSQQLEEDQCENSKSTTLIEQEPNSNFHKSQTDQDQNAPVLKSTTSFTNDRRREKCKRESKIPKHQKSHDGRNQHVGKTLESRQTVLKHKTINTGEKPHVCPTCGKGFTLRCYLNRHKVIHTGLKPYVCQTCGKGLSSKYNRDQHQRIHTGEKPYLCQTCGKGFSYKSIFSDHQNIHTGEKPYVCQTCGQAFGKRMSLKCHEKTHICERPHVCQTCGKGYTRKSSLIQHQNIHTGKKRFVCLTCGKSFKRNTYLSKHKVIHTGLKPFVCQTCGMGFSFKCNLYDHQKVHTGEKPHVCQTCGKGFSRRSTLHEHQRVHTGEKPYVCHICGKGFSRNSTLHEHQRVHMGEKPYVCQTCGQIFMQKGSLICHEKTHKGESQTSSKV